MYIYYSSAQSRYQLLLANNVQSLVLTGLKLWLFLQRLPRYIYLELSHWELNEHSACCRRDYHGCLSMLYMTNQLFLMVRNTKTLCLVYGMYNEFLPWHIERASYVEICK